MNTFLLSNGNISAAPAFWLTAAIRKNGRCGPGITYGGGAESDVFSEELAVVAPLPPSPATEDEAKLRTAYAIRRQTNEGDFTAGFPLEPPNSTRPEVDHEDAG